MARCCNPACLGAIICPTGFLRRRMKTDVADVHSAAERHAEGLDSAVKVLLYRAYS